MTSKIESLSRKQLTKLAAVGIILLLSFVAVFFFTLVYNGGLLSDGGLGAMIMFSFSFSISYVLVMSVYVGYLVSAFARGRRRYPFRWAIIGFVLTVVAIILLYRLRSSLLPYWSPICFAFLAPIWSALFTILLIDSRGKPSA